MSQISDIRKFVGHAPIMCCAAGALIFNEQGEVLLQKRSDDGTWGNPGGSLELGESTEDALKREILEETGLEIKNPKFFKLYSGKDGYVKYPNGDEVYYLNAIYTVTDYSGTLTANDGESLELKFFKLNEVPQNTTKIFGLILKDLQIS